MGVGTTITANAIPGGPRESSEPRQPHQTLSTHLNRAVEAAQADGRVLVVCQRRSAVTTWMTFLLRHHPELTGRIRVTTWSGLAEDLLRRRSTLTVLCAAERRTLIAEMLTKEKHALGPDHAAADALWPTQHRFLSSPSFLDAVVREMSEMSEMSDVSMDGHSPELGSGRRGELRRFARRFRTELAARQLVDGAQALEEAAALYRADAAIHAQSSAPPPEQFTDVDLLIVEPTHALEPKERMLAQACADLQRARGGEVAEAEAGSPTPAQGPIVDHRCGAIRAHHPSLEADAALAVVQGWLAAGWASDRIAVVLPRRNDVVVSELVSAATRCGIALSTDGRRLGDHQLIIDCAAEIAAQPAPADAVADAVFAWWTARARVLLADPFAVHLVQSFHAAIVRSGNLAQALERAVPGRPGGVCVIALADAATVAPDRRWLGLVLLQAVDGVLPQREAHRPWFGWDSGPGTDSDAVGRTVGTGGVDDADDGADVAARADRRLLVDALGALAYDGEFVAIAAPMPGVLPSRFLDGWRRRELTLVRPPGTGDADRRGPLVETTNAVPIFPTGTLRLSATQLNTFEDCSWRYGFEYGLGLRGAGGASASAGSLVHRVLEEFLRPDSAAPERTLERTLERLLELLDEWWDASEFRYNAQALDYRRRAEQWLTNWWEDFRSDPPNVARTEYRFEVPLLETPFPDAPAHGHVIVGSIDRLDVIDPLVEGAEPTTRVVDYKSGAAKSQSEVDDDLQLAVYHLAATRDPELRALGLPSHLELHYLQDAQSRQRLKVMARTVTNGLEDATVERIASLADAILAEGYEPNIDATCAYCAFHRLCPTQPSGRHVQ